MAGIPNWSELTPAYGRIATTKTGKQAKADLLSGKDLVLASTGQYLSIHDIAPGTTVLLRFNQSRGVTSVKVTQAMLDKLKGE